MVRVENITDAPHQRHTILFENAEVVLVLRFLPTVGMWFFDAEYGGTTMGGYKLSVGVLHMRSRNMPFDFVVEDASGAGLDPFRRDDFATGRCRLYMLQTADMEAIRGVPVPL